MAGPRTMIPRGKTILPEFVTSKVGRALKCATGRLGINLPSVFLDTPVVIPDGTSAYLGTDIAVIDTAANFLDSVEGIFPPGVINFADHATRVATPSASIKNETSLLTKGLRLFTRPVDNLFAGLTMSAMPLLHFHGGDYSTKRIALPLTGQKVAGVISIDWGDIRSTISPKIEGIIARVIKTVSENSTPNLAEIRIFLHSGKSISALSLSKKWAMIRGDAGKPHERRYALHGDRQILVVDLFGITPEILEEYAGGFLSSEINSAFFDLLGKSMRAPKTIPVKEYFDHIEPKSRLYWEFNNTSLLLNEGGSGPGIHFGAREMEHTLPSTMPAIPGARFRMEFNPYRAGISIMEYLESHQLNLSISVSIPADSPELIERELVDNRPIPDYFRNFAGGVMKFLIIDYRETFENLFLGFKNLDLEIYLTPGEAGITILDVDTVNNRMPIRLTLPIDMKIVGPGILTMSSEPRIDSLLTAAIHAYRDRFR